MAITGYNNKKVRGNTPAAENNAPDLFEQCRKFTTAKEIMAAGFYPYFQVVESEQDPEVIVEGRKMIMLG